MTWLAAVLLLQTQTAYKAVEVRLPPGVVCVGGKDQWAACAAPGARALEVLDWTGGTPKQSKIELDGPLMELRWHPDGPVGVVKLPDGSLVAVQVKRRSGGFDGSKLDLPTVEATPSTRDALEVAGTWRRGGVSKALALPADWKQSNLYSYSGPSVVLATGVGDVLAVGALGLPEANGPRYLPYAWDRTGAAIRLKLPRGIDAGYAQVMMPDGRILGSGLKERNYPLFIALPNDRASAPPEIPLVWRMLSGDPTALPLPKGFRFAQAEAHDETGRIGGAAQEWIEDRLRWHAVIWQGGRVYFVDSLVKLPRRQRADRVLGLFKGGEILVSSFPRAYLLLPVKR
jgi:hypothetical protein